MTVLQHAVRSGVATIALMALGACSSTGGIGDVLGGVLGGGASASQVAGTIEGVDTQSQQIALRQSNGQTVAIAFDNNTKVVYQNQNYPVTALEYGDQVLARVQSTANGAYYTDSVQVTQSVTTGGTSGGSIGGTGNVQSLQGVVRQVDRTSGQFTMDANNGVLLTVSLPYNPRTSDVNRFQSLRIGESVRFYGVFLNNSRVELRQFY